LVKNKIDAQGEHDPDDAPDGCFLKLNNVRLAVENAQIELQHKQHKNQKSAVKPPVFGKWK